MAQKDLIKNDFLMLVNKVNRDIIIRVHELDPHSHKKGEEFQKLLYENEKYVVDIFLSAMNILGTVEQLNFVPIFLRNFPRRKRFNQYGINHPKYLQYHLEIHFIKIATLIDQAAILINKVYRFGIPEKKCSVDNILENDHTKYSGAAKVLKIFDRSIQGVKSVRNLIVHRGIFKDEELNEIGMYYHLSEIHTPSEDVLFPEWVLKAKTKFTIKNKLVTINNNNKAVYDFVSNCFDSLVKEFKNQHKLLSASKS